MHPEKFLRIGLGVMDIAVISAAAAAMLLLLSLLWQLAWCHVSSLRLRCVRVLISENYQHRQRLPHHRRDAVVRKVQVVETLHEGLRGYTNLSVGRLQSVATQMLPTQQPDGVQHAELTPAVCPLQQSAML